MKLAVPMHCNTTSVPTPFKIVNGPLSKIYICTVFKRRGEVIEGGVLVSQLSIEGGANRKWYMLINCFINK